VRREWLFWLIPCLLAFILYLWTVGFGLIFDDRPLIVENPQVHSWDYLPRLLTTHLWSYQTVESPIPQYRPVFSVWLLMVYSFAGASPGIWHLVSVLLHVLATYLLYSLARESLGSAYAASAAALLFAVHPIHVEAVSWVASCNEPLYTILVVSSLFVFCRGLRGETIGWFSVYWKALSVILWTAAIFTKESALPVLAVFFYLAYMSNASLALRQRLVTTVRLVAPYLAAVFLYFGARFFAIGGFGLEKGEHTWQQVFCSTPSICVFYLQKLVLPFKLSPFYLNPVLSLPQSRVWATYGILLLLFTVLGWLSLRHSFTSSTIGLASLLLFLPMLPVLVGIRTFFEGELSHDRYMYLPSVGLCLFVGLVAHRCLNFSKKASLPVGAVLVVLFVLLTLAQEKFYKNDEAYFKRGIEVSPDNVRVIDYLGEYYASSGRMDEALREIKRAHAMKPNDSDTNFHLAIALFNDKQFSAAEPYLQQLSRLSGDAPSRHELVLFALGQTELSLSHLGQAQSILRQLASEDDYYPGLHGTLGSLYVLLGRISDGQKEFSREAEVTGDPAARHNAAYLNAVLRGEAPPPPQAGDSSPMQKAP